MDAWLQSRIEARKKIKKPKVDWSDHNTIFKANGWIGPRDPLMMTAVVPSLTGLAIESLTPREADVLFFHVIVNKHSRSGSGTSHTSFVYDLFHSLGRVFNQSPKVDRLPTI